MQLRLNPRNTSAQALITLGLLLAMLVIAPIGFLAFEAARMYIASEQLRSACDSAALAGAATLASSDSMDPNETHESAVQTALNTFRHNTILGIPMDAASLSGDGDAIPTIGQSCLYIEFLDPKNNNQPVSQGDPKGKILRLTTTFNAPTALVAYLGLGPVPLRAISHGGVPDLDLVLCFDLSGSMDDQSVVTFVRRQWNTNQNKIDYIIPPTSGGPRSSAQGKLYDLIGPPATGTRVNGLYPQYLSTSNQSGVRWPLNFSEKSGASGSARGLRGSANTGSPPGNCPPLHSGTGNQYTYTDLVVNIDGKQSFGGITINGYSFPNVASLVEASRGNLENYSVFSTSKAETALPGLVPRAGYQAQYWAMCRSQLHPISDAQSAADDFLTVMNTNTNAHFGLVTFSDNAGRSASDTYTAYNVDSNYSQAGQSQFAIPQIFLDKAVDANPNLDSIATALPATVATTSTNIGDAVLQAVRQLQNNSRSGAKKAIILFTDGEPTVGTPLSSDPWTNARKAAVEAKKAGIPIYTIGLAQNQEIIPSEINLLNDTNPSTTSGGLAAIAGNGGRFFLVTDVSNLRATFENIARQLVQLVP